MEQTELRQQGAVLLAHARVARLADSVSARVLFINGPTAVAVGARPARPSSDVDVLVDPRALRDLAAALGGAGWAQRFSGPTFEHATEDSLEHSLHLVHPQWPDDIDLHYAFPGFLAERDDTFEALWQRRVEVDVAGRRVASPDRPGQLLVFALHALRSPQAPPEQSRHHARQSGH